MYILGSHIADPDVPALTEQVKKFVSDFGGTDIEESQLGKKKLAYPVKKTRNGYYVVVNFNMDAKKINELDARIRTQDQNIIRYILINLDEHLERMEKDKKLQAQLPKRNIPAPVEDKPVLKTESKPKVEIAEIDEKALDEKIEAALSEDLTK
jgi:small subunit ribosomal protein S6